eukprot:TRINITY_DN1233_c1_g1_i3.p2 TRINITY_DN1233_c1_g1~~TRINITY_DN1233_c1_g1_i3.p2  ORF type:complete len:235 (-),score=57.49 TRINITY_DN1233_c1_g1_i3:672-1376(-)
MMDGKRRDVGLMMMMMMMRMSRSGDPMDPRAPTQTQISVQSLVMSTKGWKKKVIVNNRSHHEKILPHLDDVTQGNCVTGNVTPFDVKIGNELGILILTELDQNTPVELHRVRFDKARKQKCKKLIVLMKKKLIGKEFYALQLFATQEYHFRCIAVGNWEEMGSIVSNSGKQINSKRSKSLFDQTVNVDSQVFQGMKKVFPKMSRKQLMRLMGEFRNLRNLANAGADVKILRFGK